MLMGLGHDDWGRKHPRRVAAGANWITHTSFTRLMWLTFGNGNEYMFVPRNT